MFKEIIKNLDLEIKELSKNPKNVKDYSRFYKDKKSRISLTAPLVKKISSKYFKKIKDLDKNYIFALCDELLKLHYQSIAFDWAFRENMKERILKFLKVG